MKGSWQVETTLSLMLALVPPAFAAQTAVYTYDAAGRLTSATYDDTLATTFTYDLNGNILAIETVRLSTGVAEGAGAPARFALRGSAPNPFRGSTTLAIDMPAGYPVTLTIYSVAGRRVRGLVDAVLPPGRHAIRWDGSDDAGRPVASGRYFACLRAGRFEVTSTLSVLR